ncbi:uncharacterized protein LOC117224492 [Megalopta genalis]|uniref:uncharacterized protein LOC117224492 n=1 Tax=Megalopta genalis TaxID=115081 RepID=UPI003FD5D784
MILRAQKTHLARPAPLSASSPAEAGPPIGFDSHEEGLNYCVYAGVSSQNYVLHHGTAAVPMVLPTDTTRTIGRKFPCTNCTSSFSRKGGLTYHQKFECGQEPRFKCPYCTYRASHISNTRRHVRKRHPGREVYTLDLCQLMQNV